MKTLYHFSLIILLAFAVNSSFAQNNPPPAQVLGSAILPPPIKGKVIDAQTNKPVAGANVYLNGTYAGTATDADGNFTLPAMQTNTPLIVSYVGYESQTIKDYGDKELSIKLKPKTTQLKEVVIADEEMSREKKMKIFLREFIGQNYKDCVITNPDDIWLHFNGKTYTLTGGADKPIVIYNKKLAYKITYFLDTFRYVENISMGNETHYRGNYFFTEDTAGLKQSEIKKILIARDDAYYGSRMFFIRTLWADQLRQNDFKILEPTSKNFRRNVYDEKAKKVTYLHYNDIVGVLNNSKFHDQKYIKLKTEVAVLYEPKKHKEKTSYLLQEQGYEGILIDNNGFSGQGLDWNGDMGQDRVAMLLPYEFQPIDK